MKDFLVVGDVMTDNILQITDSEIINSIDSEEHTISMPFPGKLQLTKPPKILGGGNAFTASHALSRLGLSTMIYTVTGDDYPGQQLISKMSDAGIDTSLALIDKESGTNSSYIMAAGSDRLIFSHHFDREYVLDTMPEVNYVFLTSIGEDDRKLFRQLLRYKQERNYKLIFSPGTRQIKENFSDIREVLEATDYLILNKGEAVAMSRLNTDNNETLLQELSKHGPKNVIITRSDRGSIAYDGQDIYKVGALKVKIVETTGAGDTFAATFAAGIASGKSLTEAMEWGAINGAEVCKYIGTVEWQLDMEKLTAAHAENRSQLEYIDGSGD